MKVIPELHLLEQVASEQHIGTLAENLLEAMSDHPACYEEVCVLDYIIVCQYQPLVRVRSLCAFLNSFSIFLDHYTFLYCIITVLPLPLTHAQIKRVRKATRQEKKRRAMAMRQKELGALGMQVNEKGQVIAQSALVTELEGQLIEESGLKCCICLEGYKNQPQKVGVVSSLLGVASTRHQMLHVFNYSFVLLVNPVCLVVDPRSVHVH